MVDNVNFSLSRIGKNLHLIGNVSNVSEREFCVDLSSDLGNVLRNLKTFPINVSKIEEVRCDWYPNPMIFRFKISFKENEQASVSIEDVFEVLRCCFDSKEWNIDKLEMSETDKVS